MAPQIYSRPTHSPAVTKRRSGPSAARAATLSKFSATASDKTLRPPSEDEVIEPFLMASLLGNDYRSDIEEHMHRLDAETIPTVETMDLQPELEWFMRPFLIDFMIEIHLQYRMKAEVLQLAVNIVDRYVARRVVFKKHYQLVGCSALWMAAKYEDSKERVPSVSELTAMCCNAYEEASFVQMEGHVLSTIGWSMGHPTPEAFLRLRLADEDSTSLSHLPLAQTTRFLIELCLFERMFVSCRSADIANGALMLSRFILRLARRPSEETEGGRKVMFMLDELLADPNRPISEVVVKKYAFGYFVRASRIIGDWYGSGHRLLAPRVSKSSSITSSPTSSLLTLSSSGPRSVAWSSPGSSVKAEEEDTEREDTVGLQASPSIPFRMGQTRIADLHPTSAAMAADSKHGN